MRVKCLGVMRTLNWRTEKKQPCANENRFRSLSSPLRDEGQRLLVAHLHFRQGQRYGQPLCVLVQRSSGAYRRDEGGDQHASAGQGHGRVTDPLWARPNGPPTDRDPWPLRPRVGYNLLIKEFR